MFFVSKIEIPLLDSAQMYMDDKIIVLYTHTHTHWFLFFFFIVLLDNNNNNIIGGSWAAEHPVQLARHPFHKY